MKKLLLGIIAVGLAVSMSANAAFIQGAISMDGDWRPTVGGAVTTDVSTATGIHFSTAEVTATPSGNLAFIPAGTAVSMTDFIFSPFAPVVSLYTITFGGGVLSFDLTSITIPLQNSNFLVLEGLGTMYLTGFDPTPGVWNFSANTVPSQATFSWSASSAAIPVPEPATLMLLGMGLIGLALVRRRAIHSS